MYTKRTNGTLSGIIPPIITPLTEKYELDVPKVEKVVDHCIKGGVSGVFALGSTGEACRVSRKVWQDMLAETIKVAKGRTTVFCGCVDTSTERTIEDIKIAEQLGAEYVVATAPFYIQYSAQSEILRHFEKIAASTKLKVVMYNIPCMVHCSIAPETAAQLADIDNIVAMKDSSADWEFVQRLLFHLEGKNISFFNGAEELCGAAMEFGADGCVPGLGVYFPELFVDMYKAALAGDTEKVYQLQKQCWAVRKSLSVGKHWLPAMKHIGYHLGLCNDLTTFPIEPLTDAEKKEIDRILLDVMGK